MSGLVLSVNVSEVRTVEYRGAAVTTGIFKTPVKGRIPISGVNLRGDDQADRWNVERRRIGAVGAALLDNAQFVALERERVVLIRLGGD